MLHSVLRMDRNCSIQAWYAWSKDEQESAQPFKLAHASDQALAAWGNVDIANLHALTKGRIMSIVLLLLLLLILLVLLGAFGMSWYIAAKVLNRRSTSVANIPVISVNGATEVTLQRTKNTRLPGLFGIKSEDGTQAIVGPILSSDANSVTRPLILTTGIFTPGTKVAWNTNLYVGDLREHLQMEIKEVSFPGPLGEMPAWLAAGSTIWGILVHGSTATREQGLRVYQSLASLGLTILNISYRNDKGAPANGLSHLGNSEWEDLEAAVKYALAHGAESIILFGWSMGGTIVLTFLDRSEYAKKVRACVLDSPVLNWQTTLYTQIKNNKLPGFLAALTEKIISIRTGISFNDLALDRTDKQLKQIPILLFHGVNDRTAPISASDAFASLHTNVTYHRVPAAEHTQCWNVDPSFYESKLTEFLTQVRNVHLV